MRRALNEPRRFRLIDWKRRGLNRPNVDELLTLVESPHLFPPDAGYRNLAASRNPKQGHEEYSRE